MRQEGPCEEDYDSLSDDEPSDSELKDEKKLPDPAINPILQEAPQETFEGEADLTNNIQLLEDVRGSLDQNRSTK